MYARWMASDVRLVESSARRTGRQLDVVRDGAVVERVVGRRSSPLDEVVEAERADGRSAGHDQPPECRPRVDDRVAHLERTSAVLFEQERHRRAMEFAECLRNDRGLAVERQRRAGPSPCRAASAAC